MSGGEHTPDPSARHRLPYTVSPRRYRIHLRPELDAEAFSGTVVIEAEVAEATDRIVLHALELQIGAAEVRSGGRVLRPSVAADPDHEDRIALVFDEPLLAGPVQIDLAFRGKLLEQLCGFYRSTFVDEAGVRQAIATTQFEATDARRAFPCFDEPDRKAVFSVSTDVPDGMEGFSNSPVISAEPLAEGGTRLQFADTISMSTYLVALVVGPLQATDPVEADGTAIRVVHVPGRQRLTGFAVEAADHALRFFVEWFGLPYPGAKLDMVAVPDFAFGAMENLGCVVFRETTLLVDPGRSSRLELERVADVVSHEIAHMWFGDLVTMKWWNGIWLNEAFASLMEMLAVDHFRPEWERWVSFGSERDSAMATDALSTTRPVEYPVGSPDEAQGMFDVLTYQKGAGVLRMLERYLGAERFQAGIRLYLAEHQLSNTETGDLWDAIEKATEEPVHRIMDSWILQGGFPLLTVSRRNGQLTLRQEAFSYSPAASQPSAGATGATWSVPVLVRPLGGSTSDVQRVLLEDEQLSVDAGAGPVVVNAGGWGFYRVRYDQESLDALLAQVDALETLERYNLLSDTWASVVAGTAQLRDFFRLAEAMRTEQEPAVWRLVIGALDLLDHLVDDDVRPALAAYNRSLVGPAFRALGWEPRPGEGERIATLRADLLRSLGTVGADPDVRAVCLERHQQAMGEGPPLDPDLAPAVVAVVARAGGPAEFEAFLARHHNPQTPQEAVRYLQALAAFEDRSLAERAFAIATTEARTQDAPFVIYVLLANRATGAAAWEWVEGRWQDLQSRFPVNMFPRMIEAVSQLCRDPELVARVATFLAEHPIPAGQRTVNQAMERQGVNLALAMRLRPTLTDELESGTRRLAEA